ncbi:uncharacterized protein LOC112576830 isoform X2 [Pomacea canaliculata]|nr:uncharacterized protein LOC112576830 isoform X2 [Pomacea canaliculata]
MSGVGELLSKSRQKEERLRKTKEFLAKHLHDRLFVDYFNVFLNLPVFGQRMLFKLHDGDFIFDPPVFTGVIHDRIVAWIAARRFHLFTKTHLFLEYQLCHKLKNLDFELRFRDSDCDRRTHHVLQVFANNLLGSVAGMYLFREHLRNSSGSKVFGCWLHVQRFRQTRNLTKRREIFHEIQQCYLLATAFHKLSNRLCRVVAVELLSFPVVPHSETELSARLTTDHYVPSCEVDLSSPKALGLVHRVLLEALRAYWAPCYVMHVLSTQPFSILKELFRVPKGTDLKMLIRRCTLFKVSGDLGSSPKDNALSGKDDLNMPSSSSMLLTLSSSSTHITHSTQETTLTYLPYLQSSTEPSRILALATRHQLHLENTGFIVPELPSREKTQGRDTLFQDDTNDGELTEMCVEERLLDTECYCDNSERESRRHEEKQEAKVSDEMEDEDDSKVRLNLTRLALKEMAIKPEPMLYLNQLLRHYLFGYRHLNQEEPVTDRRTLCLLACDDLAGSPFRSYLRGQAQQLYLSYFDFWSAMRRYQQLHDLNQMEEIMHSKSCSMIADAHRQHIHYMVNRFLIDSGVDANILGCKIRLSLLEDIRKARWSPLINSTLDVVSNVLSIPMTQFILYDRQDFRKHAMDSSNPLPNLEQDSQAENIMASDLPMQIPSASLRTFADRRCLSDPWREDPKHDPDGDMECLRPTDPRGTKYNGVVGVLGEQHRLLAFQFLIVLREDLPDAQVCDVASLARIVGSDYGSLHIPFSAPVTHRFLASLRPKQRMSRATLLKPSPLMEDFLSPVINRLGPMHTLTMNDLLEYRRKRSELVLKLPRTPRKFLDILAHETQFNVFKKYLELKGQLKAVSFVEDVQDALRLLDQAEQESMVAGIIEQYFGDGERILNIQENQSIAVIIVESPNLENLCSAQLALEKQIEEIWFNKYVEELERHKVDLPTPNEETYKEDWLENFLLEQEEKTRIEAEENKKRLQKIKKQEEKLEKLEKQKEKRKGKTEKREKHTEKGKVKKDKREKHAEKMDVEEAKKNQETIKDLESTDESSDSSYSSDRGEVEKGEWKEEKEHFKERKKKPQAKKGKEKNLQDKEDDRAKRKRDRKNDKQEKQVDKDKRVRERKEHEFKDPKDENEEKTSVTDTESEEEQDYEATSFRQEMLDREKQTFEDFEQKKIQKKERREHDEKTSSGAAKRKRDRKNDKQEKQVDKDKRVRERKEHEFKDPKDENEEKTSVTDTESEEEQDYEATSFRQEMLDREKQTFEDFEQKKIQKKERREHDEKTSSGAASLNQMTSKRQAKISKEEDRKVKDEYKSGEEDEGTSSGTDSLNEMTSKRLTEISKGDKKKKKEIMEEKKRELKKKKNIQEKVDRLKENEKEDKKSDILLSETPTDAQAAIKEKIPKEKKEIPEEIAYQAEESIKSDIFEDSSLTPEYFEHMEQSVDSAESSISVYDRSQGLKRKAKPIDLWRHVVREMVKFTSSLIIPLERKLFEMYLKQELQNAKNHLTSDKEMRTTDSEGIKHAVYTRKILNDLIQVNKLPADLRFFVEADRFKKQITSHLKCSTEIGVPIEKENPILGMRAKAIIECFFQSVCEPVVQVNLCPEKTVSQIIKSKSLSVDMFHDVYIHVYPLLFKMWKIFAHQWLSSLRVNQRKKRIEMILASFKDPIIGDCPHPEEPTADYLPLRLSDYKYAPLGDKELKGISGSMLKFTISRGVRILVNEAEQKKSNKLPSPEPLAINENRNNFYKVTNEKDKRDNVFFETQYQNKGKIDQSNKCPGNSDMTGSHVEFSVYAKTLECRERKRDLGIGRSTVPKTCNNILQDRDCVVAMEERGQKYQRKPEPKQKGEVYSAPKVCSEPKACSEPKVMTSKQMGGEKVEEEDSVTIEERERKHKVGVKSDGKKSAPKVCSEPKVVKSGQMGGKKAEEEENDTLAQKYQASTHRSDRRETFNRGDKQIANDGSEKFIKQANRETSTAKRDETTWKKKLHNVSSKSQFRASFR